MTTWTPRGALPASGADASAPGTARLRAARRAVRLAAGGREPEGAGRGAVPPPIRLPDEGYRLQ